MVKKLFSFRCSDAFARRRVFVLTRLNTTFPRLHRKQMPDLYSLQLIVVFIVVLFWMTFPVSARANNAIHGLVTDAQNSPLDGVEIHLDGVAVKTKSDGRFRWVIPERHTGKIPLTFTKLGYAPQTVTVEAGNTSNNAVNVTLVSTGDPQVGYKLTKVTIEPEVLSIIADKWGDKFKHVEYPNQYFDTIKTVEPGDDIQSAIDSANSAGGGIVFLKAGTHTVNSGLKLRSKVTLCGEGRTKTIVKQGSSMRGSILSQGSSPLTDVVLKDITFQGNESRRAGGLNLRGNNSNRHTRFMFQNVTITGFGSHGVGISRINNVIMDNSVFQRNGSSGSLHHNVYFLYVTGVLQSDCDMSYPVTGKSNKFTATSHVITQRCVLKEGLTNGIQADHEQADYLFFHKYHMSGFKRVAMWFPCEHYYDKYNYTEDPKYAPQNVILNRCEIVNNTWGAMWRVVTNSYVINSHFANDKIDMGLLKCDVTMENSTFEKGNEIYTDVKQWPSDVKILW